MSEYSEAEQKVRRSSRYCAAWMDSNPERYAQLRDNGRLDQAEGALADWPAAQLRGLQSDDEFMRELRVARNECMFVIAWLDLLGVADLTPILTALTQLAERCIAAALTFGQARFADDAPAEIAKGDGLFVIGMGKLGGGELNYSSDIDLIFCFAGSAGDDQDAAHALGAYYKRLARWVIHALGKLTENGFVFRVDTRLRPFGDSGPLVTSTDAMENYYQAHGREWERYAWIKARPVAGDLGAGNALIKRLHPFVYRRYLDFNAFESIRDMKALIKKQVARKGLENNIKIGRGGIREIEFVAQAFQLIRGGHEPNLQDTRLMPVLKLLGEAGHLPAHVVSALTGSYIFLRRVENRLQMWDDRQTHDLPTDDTQKLALALAMHYADWSAFADDMAEHRRNVDEHFQQIFAAPQIESDVGDAEQVLLGAWEEDAQTEQAEQALAGFGLEQPVAAWRRLLGLREGMMYRTLGDRGRRRLAQLLPMLIQVAAQTSAPDQALKRATGVLEKIIGRNTYVALLVESPTALSRLVELCAASPWITRLIETQPILLDTLLDTRQLYRPPEREELQQELNAALNSVPETDLEQRMDVLRRFQQQAMLRIAAADLSNSMPLMVVSDRLTELAEVVLNGALEEAWAQMAVRYGQPRLDGAIAPFLVIGYGKLGGLELGYGSDLDLVFIHGGDLSGQTDGKRQLSHQAFFLRLAQRLIHLLSTQTSAGRVYEVDPRLRPSGQSGLLVSNLDAFTRYQNEKAWTWEHQALVRARAVAGDADLGKRFRNIREQVLIAERSDAELREQVIAMRTKMRSNLESKKAGMLDLKQMPGGLIDIEFLAQYAVLRYADDCRELLIFTDTIRILETLESAQLMELDTVRKLTDAYREYRKCVHRDALQQTRAMIRETEFAAEREAVCRAWQVWIGKSS